MPGLRLRSLGDASCAAQGCTGSLNYTIYLQLAARSGGHRRRGDATQCRAAATQQSQSYTKQLPLIATLEAGRELTPPPVAPGGGASIASVLDNQPQLEVHSYSIQRRAR